MQPLVSAAASCLCLGYISATHTQCTVNLGSTWYVFCDVSSYRTFGVCELHIYRILYGIVFCSILFQPICMLPIVLSATEVIPGMEAPPPVSQEPILQDASGESFDDPPTSFQDSSAESRRESHKHASSSGTKDTTPSSHSSSGTSSRRRATDHAAHSNLSGNDASNGEVSGDSGGQQHQAGNGNSNGNGVRGGEASLPNGAGAEQVKQAVSIVGNKMQQVVHEEGVDIASRSALAYLH